MRRFSKRLWATLLAAVMVAGLMPALTLQAKVPADLLQKGEFLSYITATHIDDPSVPITVGPTGSFDRDKYTNIDVYYVPELAASGLELTIPYGMVDTATGVTFGTETGLELGTPDESTEGAVTVGVTLSGTITDSSTRRTLAITNLTTSSDPITSSDFTLTFLPVNHVQFSALDYPGSSKGLYKFLPGTPNRGTSREYDVPTKGVDTFTKGYLASGYYDHMICDIGAMLAYKPVADPLYKFTKLEVIMRDSEYGDYTATFDVADNGDLVWVGDHESVIHPIAGLIGDADYTGYYPILSTDLGGVFPTADLGAYYEIHPSFVRITGKTTGGNNSSRPSTGTTTNTTGIPTDTKTTDDITKQIDEGTKTVGVALGSGESEVSLTSDQLKDILDAGTGIAFTDETGTVTLTLSPEALAAAGIDGTKDVTFQVTPVDEAALPDAVKAQLDAMDEETRAWVVSKMFHISVSGQTEFSQPLLLTVDLSDLDLTQEQKDAFTGIRYNEDGSVDQLGGTWDKSGTKFSFYTSKTSTYGVLVSENLVKLNMAVGRSGYTLNGSAKTMDVAPQLIEDRTMVPLRFVAEALGAEVGWDAATKTVSVDLDGESLKVTIGVRAPGMDVPATIVNDRTMVPIRYVAESLGCNVVWNADSSTIDIYR